VEMTPSRPELRHRKETLTSPLNHAMASRLAESQPFASDTQAVVASQRALEVSRNDSSSSAPAVLEPKAGTDSMTAPASVEPASESRPAEVLTPRQPEPLQVLVVDDDSLTRNLMTRLLTRLGCIVTTGENGVKALEILLGSVFTPSESATPSTAMPSTPGTSNSGVETNVPSQPRFFDIVFLDNQMPLMSGLEAIARLRAAGREDLVVGVTGNALIRDQDEYLTAGVDHVLIKPVLEKNLKQMLSVAERRRTADVTENEQ
jgi:osomolarity two-component system, sensor histidine kinase SLN1